MNIDIVKKLSPIVFSIPNFLARWNISGCWVALFSSHFSSFAITPWNCTLLLPACLCVSSTVNFPLQLISSLWSDCLPILNVWLCALTYYTTYVYNSSSASLKGIFSSLGSPMIKRQNCRKCWLLFMLQHAEKQYRLNPQLPASSVRLIRCVF